ncbi:MAG: MFS transporter [Candidatus Sericytochromatia bacterium]|nr:MAG: MFS transporter [Candidatus Sericytochromatia bacterium]
MNERKNIILAVVVASLGYFVDIYDLLLFSIVRVNSLKGIGIINEEDILNHGLYLLNMQMLGMLLGGIFWGILGDKKGRLSVLFGSIFLYSIANILNGLVQTVEQYSLLRLIAGIGLAGELGAGITLVSELMSKESRGYGTTIVATIGILGAVVGAFVGKLFDWRTAYFIGGIMGLFLLLLRVGLLESNIFSSLKETSIQRGNFFQLFQNKEIFFRYLNCILIGLPIWFVVGILITFSPEFGKEFGMENLPIAGESVKYCYIGLSIGDLSSGLLSQKIKSRKKAVGIFIILTAISILLYFTFANISLEIFYTICLVLGFSIGYWAVFVTISAENFGTNLRATVTTSVPNFIRGSVVPITIVFQELKSIYTLSTSAMIVGFSTILISLISLSALKETYGKDLNYVE